MVNEYEVFECLLDGSVRWREHVCGVIKARGKLRVFSESSEAQFFAMELQGRTVLFPSKATALGERVFQIAYDGNIGRKRAHFLRGIGYGVLSVLGNPAAQNLLMKVQPRGVTSFLVGHAAPARVRTEMVDWLKSVFPKVEVVALNPPNQLIVNADCNVLQTGPEFRPPFLFSASPDNRHCREHGVLPSVFCHWRDIAET